MKVLHSLSTVAHAAGARLLDLFLPKVTADARCLEAFTFCKCVKHVRYVWDLNCHNCIHSGSC
jgi:hypothetical protein